MSFSFFLSILYVGNEENVPKKPDVIKFYNKNKDGVENLDKMIVNYTFARKTKVWPVKFFMYLIDFAAHNSVIMKKYSNNQAINTSSIYYRRKCLEELAIDLMKPYVEERYSKIEENKFRYVDKRFLDCIEKTGVIKR
ncbi:unnamed protein product [Brachionus calyciflorus]|uniref:PiggyBac transposable element-derived protein domain-containing protein n=1 Tax=Brachionus calyciflorus TaxID=104777 RepID=A0A814PFA0_9BILA|nr:unnamed protein product [Brachionus calyciflorus]